MHPVDSKRLPSNIMHCNGRRRPSAPKGRFGQPTGDPAARLAVGGRAVLAHHPARSRDRPDPRPSREGRAHPCRCRGPVRGAASCSPLFCPATSCLPDRGNRTMRMAALHLAGRRPHIGCVALVAQPVSGRAAMNPFCAIQSCVNTDRFGLARVNHRHAFLPQGEPSRGGILPSWSKVSPRKRAYAQFRPEPRENVAQRPRQCVGAQP